LGSNSEVEDRSALVCSYTNNRHSGVRAMPFCDTPTA
jgi:hypothetical protein